MLNPITDRLKDLLPRSRYVTSMEGLTWNQVLSSPLPPYLSPLPVMFRMLAYLTIAPFILLLALDFGGYLVFRIWEQPFWSGTRTAFYKFRASPVFSMSAKGSPVAHKTAQFESGLHSPDAKSPSLSPISSTGSLTEDMGHASTSPNSPVTAKRQLASRFTQDQPKPSIDGSVSEDQSGSPLTRTNSLGLGFAENEDPGSTTRNAGSGNQASSVAMFFVSPSVPSVASTSAVSSFDISPNGSTGSSRSLEEDDKAFNEAKNIPNE